MSAVTAPRVPRKLVSAARRLPLWDAPVIELGCGSGQHLAHLHPASVGVDLDPRALERVARLGRQAVRRDLARPGWSDGLEPHALVLCVDLLVHLPEPEVLLAEIPRLLTPEGRLLVCEWVWPEGRALGALAALVPGARAHRAHPEHLHAFSEASLAALLEGCGLVLEETWVHSVPSRVLGGLLRPFWPPRSFLAKRGGGSGGRALE